MGGRGLPRGRTKKISFVLHRRSINAHLKKEFPGESQTIKILLDSFLRASFYLAGSHSIELVHIN